MTLVLNGTTGVSSVDGSASTPAIQGADTNTGVFFPAADTVAIATGGAERVRTDSSGNVGIGTSSPSRKLEVGLLGAFRLQTGSVTMDCTPTAGATDSFVWNTSSNNPYIWSHNGSERARIDNGGNLLVGTTSNSYTSGAGLKMGNDGTDGWMGITGGSSTNGSVVYRLYSTGAAAYRFYVGYGGTIYATSTSISALSDQTLKENVRDLETGLTEVMALRPRRFDWKNGDAQNVAGFVAQEVEQVLPELVTDYVYNKNEDGNDIIKKSLKMGDILPTLVKAIQEQQAMIVALKAEVDALKGAQA